MKANGYGFLKPAQGQTFTNVPKFGHFRTLGPVGPTSEALAKEYEAEFKQDFERYFSDSTAYFRCLEEERGRVMIEVEETANRYDRFLTDAENWRAEN